ncbi:CinA family protein [Acidihalobacter prosperus]
MQSDNMDLAAQLGQCLLRRGMRLVTAESCTGGWIAKRVTDIAGSSDWFEAGLVTYSNRSKQTLLGVPNDLLENEGAVSAACVRSMALGACQRLGGDLAVAVSGIAGPGGGSPGKPRGTVWFGFAASGEGGKITAEVQHFPGTRDDVRQAAVEYALQGLLGRVGG